MKMVGIILAGGNTHRMKELGARRAIAAMPVAASYRAIDFALSSISNSEINHCAVLTQYNSRSLHAHLDSSRWWNFGQKLGGLKILTPTITKENGFWYRGTADSIYQNIDFLRRCHEPYVVIAAGDGVYKIDYNMVLDAHIDMQADITIVTKNMSEDVDLTRFGVVTTDSDNRIIDFKEKPLEPNGCLISTGIYVMRRRLLMELVEQAASEDRFDFVNDILIRNLSNLKICSYEMKGFWASISSVDDYYAVNMEFLKPDIRNYFFRQSPRIYAPVRDLPPAKFNPGSEVKDSLIGSGSIINGSVENSIIGKGVFIGSDAVIKNSIILHDCNIGDGAKVENCIVESNNIIHADAECIGEQETRIISERLSIDDE